MATEAERRTDTQRLASIVADEEQLDGLEGFSEADRASIEAAMRRLPDAKLRDAQWTDKPPTITKMIWWA